MVFLVLNLVTIEVAIAARFLLLLHHPNYRFPQRTGSILLPADHPSLACIHPVNINHFSAAYEPKKYNNCKKNIVILIEPAYK